MRADEILYISKIIPVISIDDENEALKLAEALYNGGIKILEITLRTPNALKAIESIAKNFPQSVVGAGTVINAKQLEAVKNAGATFAISPGISSNLAKKALELDFTLIPGVSSASELMLALEFNFTCLKFFPAQAAGGVAMLKALYAPFKEVQFCPTGGINLANMNEYLALANVSCVGGSWLSPKELIQDKKWDELTKIAQKSLALISN
ncbi:bifunctional 4-hydroxy-2-oxoglutarate aldolase/2-dehydro-3-deoxy-phosphogluconate aldolase [Campylobacter sp. MIT 97-5078]|uniref:bifunctional 4-hydroxy-2-oxoglutarate aldolase/2-dehydro-3-deoxy-phosphogluconate aldolase n=1 Tax=Campylobacter sp. MIT 97-5078 TaxID=1548153 RepID=UPI0005141E68|nr:bifunctional 4-hydroxy-2-oxoglutarate aldolase/2-dehydro-3-deoxy-phosphogluconate aldolase [Campylobacter sp. MIT 97-5078]KGI55558.1 keto-deoxy-phosphogluconate aldolase [Campylobacter sp. MIT 97-5078]KGI57775.1 keto-deoxy-phosphogluconate aldolase [Campylobacter sp. MIT 97-5078]TQR23064.1 keto-hydroxyglutarate-aldolase/keto-deoxy-phosphogluconate aldolase [Campylobacter sp. MIT 97-5078]